MVLRNVVKYGVMLNHHRKPEKKDAYPELTM
jgi:hypothetical protein